MRRRPPLSSAESPALMGSGAFDPGDPPVYDVSGTQVPEDVHRRHDRPGRTLGFRLA